MMQFRKAFEMGLEILLNSVMGRIKAVRLQAVDPLIPARVIEIATEECKELRVRTVHEELLVQISKEFLTRANIVRFQM